MMGGPSRQVGHSSWILTRTRMHNLSPTSSGLLTTLNRFGASASREINNAAVILFRLPVIEA